jgi:hypothetical protein
VTLTKTNGKVDVDATIRDLRTRLEGYEGKTLQIPETLSEVVAEVYALVRVLEEMRRQEARRYLERGTASGACPNHPYSGAVPHCAICGWSAQA